MRKIDFVDENNCSCTSQDPRGARIWTIHRCHKQISKVPHAFTLLHWNDERSLRSISGFHITGVIHLICSWQYHELPESYKPANSSQNQVHNKGKLAFFQWEPCSSGSPCLKGVGNISMQNSPSPLKITSQNWLTQEGTVIVVQSFDSNQCWVAVPLLLIHFSLISILSSIYPFSTYAKQLHHTL